ncbi:MAG: hypothetical protein SVK54_05280 [candidate division WOR-3 bacterium]|nr:hypothetical protein [candidate division WOR-3 bacterium]
MPFTYLNIPVTPVSTALSSAGSVLRQSNADIVNPAVYADIDKDQVYFSYLSHIAGTHLGFLSYNTSMFSLSVKYFNSGIMELRDSFNTYLGDFSDNTIFITGGTGMEIVEQLYAGFSITAGIEKITDYQQYCAGFSGGIIYRQFDFIDLGLYVQNAGISYSRDTDMLPARIIAGAGLNKDDLPISVYIDVGKILDDDYFYAAGFEFNLISKKESTSKERGVKTVLDVRAEINENIEADYADSLNTQYPDTFEESVSPDTAGIKSQPYDSTAESDSLDIEDNGEEYMSYADYLDELEEDTENGEEEAQDEAQEAASEDETEDEKRIMDNEEIEKQEEEDAESASRITQNEEGYGKKSFADDIEFVIRGGFSSDRTDLQSGTSTDLTAGLTGGFGISYSSITIDYAAKFWGELGIGHSVGVRIEF